MKPQPPVDLWERIDAYVAETCASNTEDEGYTTAELAARWKVPERTAHSRASRMVRDGLLVAGWKTVAIEGKRRRLRVYKPKEGD